MSLSEVKKFKDYHLDNPHIYPEFEAITLRAIDMDHRLGARAVIEILRWETKVAGKGAYKISNIVPAYYVRIFEARYPDYEGFFRKKNILPEGFDIIAYLGFPKDLMKPPQGENHE